MWYIFMGMLVIGLIMNIWGVFVVMMMGVLVVMMGVLMVMVGVIVTMAPEISFGKDQKSAQIEYHTHLYDLFGLTLCARLFIMRFCRRNYLALSTRCNCCLYA